MKKKQSALSKLTEIRQNLIEVITGSYDLIEQEHTDLLIMEDELREMMLDIEFREKDIK